MDEMSLVRRIVVWVIPVLFAITVHEVAHGWVAKKLGDPTAMMLGRLTLNPFKHIDPIGTIVVPAAMLLLTGFVFGWAKPVPVTWANLRHPKRDMALVAAAGPGANLLMAIFWALVIKLGLLLSTSVPAAAPFLIASGVAGIFINAILMILNLLPLPPLDGGRVVSGLLPGRLAAKYDRIEPYGFLILIVLMVTPVLGMIIGPPIFFMVANLATLAGLHGSVLVAVLTALGVY